MNNTPSFKRFEWIDNARVIAAFLIMFFHLPNRALDLPPPPFFVNNQVVTYVVDYLVYIGSVPFFLILAGFFLSRNITWHKAWNRFLWLFIPYAIWNVFVYGCYSLSDSPLPSRTSLLGIGSIVLEQIALAENPFLCPVIGPSWFLRDIMLLSFLTPLLVKFKCVLPAVLIVFTSVLELNKMPNPFITLSPGTCLFYVLGIYLSAFRIEDAYRIFSSKFTIAVVVGMLVGGAVGLKNGLFSGESWFTHEWKPSLFGAVFGAMIIAHCGVLIEKHLPKLSHKLASYAPACFLVFMLHMPIYYLTAPILPDCVKTSYWALLLPIPIFFFIVGFYFTMKKYTPWLLPYLAHVNK